VARMMGIIFIVAALATILGTAVVVHQYVVSPQGQWLNPWVSANTLKAFVGVVILMLPWLAIWYARRVERITLREAKQRGEDYESWRRSKDRDLSARVIGEYAALERKITDFTDTATTALDRLAKDHHARLQALVIDPTIRDGIADLIKRGDQLYTSMQTDLRGTHILGEASDYTSRVEEWEAQATTFLQKYQPGFVEQFNRPFSHFHQSPQDRYPQHEDGAYVLLQRVRARTERLTALLAARPKPAQG